jgi:hypothetical protein
MLNAADLAHMQAVQVESMIDTCVVVTVATVTGAYGGQEQVETESAPVRCGLSFASGRGQSSASILNTARGAMPAVDAVLRLPLGTPVNATSRVRVTHRAGAVFNQTFSVEGPVMPGRTCLIVGLKRLGV